MRRGETFDLIADQISASSKIRLHEPSRAQHLGIVRRGFQPNRLRVMEPVTTGIPTGLDTHHLPGDRILIQNQTDPLDWTDEFFRPVTPSHSLGDGKSGKRRLDEAGHERGRRLPRQQAAKRQPFALVGDLALEPVDRYPAGSGESQGGLCRRTVRLECRPHGRTPPNDLTIRLPSWDTAGEEGEPTRRRKGLDRLDRDSGAVELGAKTCGEGLGKGK
jgi:hypothetical protein